MLGVDLRTTYKARDIVLGKHDLTSKIFGLPLGFQAVVAGTIPLCERLISFLWDGMERVGREVSGPLQLDHIVFAARNATEQIVLSLFDNALVNQLGMTRNEWIDRQSDSTLKIEGRALLEKINPDASCLIAGFLRGSPVLIRIVGKNPPDEVVSHTAIGIGAIYALEKLAARTQGPYCSIQRTALAMSEGLRYARRKCDGFVGPPANCLILEPELIRQFNPQSKLLIEWGRTVRNSRTNSLDSEEFWKQFSQILAEAPRFSRQSGAQTLEQAQ